MPVVGLDNLGRLWEARRDTDAHARGEKVDVTRAMGRKLRCHISWGGRT